VVPGGAEDFGQQAGHLAVNCVMRGTLAGPGMSMATKNTAPGGDG
jgi:hypothetical protein